MRYYGRRMYYGPIWFTAAFIMLGFRIIRWLWQKAFPS